jgi:hypothetical protein
MNLNSYNGIGLRIEILFSAKRLDPDRVLLDFIQVRLERAGRQILKKLLGVGALLKVWEATIR